MMTRWILATTLTLGTASLSMGCEKGPAVMSALASKASELEHQLVERLGPKARHMLESVGLMKDENGKSEDGTARMPTPGFDTTRTPSGPNELWRMDPPTGDGSRPDPASPELENGFVPRFDDAAKNPWGEEE